MLNQIFRGRLQGGWKASLLTEFTKRVKSAAFVLKPKHRAGASLCVFVSGLFNGVLSTAHALNRPWTNDCDEELEGMWKETIVGCCVALFELVFWRNWGKPQEMYSQDIRPSGRASNPWPGMLIEFFGSVVLMSLVHPSSIRWMTDGFVQHWWSCNWQDKTELCVEKRLCQCHSVRHKSHMNCYESKTEAPRWEAGDKPPVL